MIRPNPDWLGYRCLQCRATYSREPLTRGCPACLAEGRPSNVVAWYTTHSRQTYHRQPLEDLPSLGEGNTPLVRVTHPALPEGEVLLKMEAFNPTGSHKDRMSRLVTAEAVRLGKTGVVAASSGNAAVSLAAYAARNGLACTIITGSRTSQAMRDRITAYGANLCFADTLPERWRLTAEVVTHENALAATNFHIPAVGSNPIGIEGYKAIAAELLEQCDPLPDWVISPSCRCDLLLGLKLGFDEALQAGRIQRAPRLVATEPFPRLSQVVHHDVPADTVFPGTTDQASIAGCYTTYQGVAALVDEGRALVINDETAAAARRQLLQQGVQLEACAAAAYGAVERLTADGDLNPTDKVVVIATAAETTPLVEVETPTSMLETPKEDPR